MKKTLSLLICGLTLQSSLAAQQLTEPLTLDSNANNLKLRQGAASQDSPFLFTADDVKLSASHLDKFMIKKELALLDPDYLFDPENPNADIQKATEYLEMLMYQKELALQDPDYVFDPRDTSDENVIEVVLRLESLAIKREIAQLDPDYSFDINDPSACEAASAYLARLKLK